jgi:acyl-CoA hydrolase
MDVTPFVIHKMVKGEDLNHHGTLFAGRGAEWFVEAGFIAAASLTNPKNIVCLKIHGMSFTKPVPPGSIVRYESKIVLSGRTKLVAFIESRYQGDVVTSGFITFVHVDENGKSVPHGLEIIPTSEQDKQLGEQAKAL